MTRVPALWIFVALVAGLGLGLGLALVRPSALPAVLAVAQPVGDLWLRALRATILPLVVGLLFSGIVQMMAAARAGAMARRALGWFMAVLVGGSAMAGLVTPALLALFPIRKEPGRPC
jgi:Na+/H+-dicarboxylate symporter